MRVFLLFYLLTFLPLTMAAQSNQRALGAAIDTIVRKYSHHAKVVDDIVEDVYQKNKKDAKFVARIAKSYFSYYIKPEDQWPTYLTNDTARALKYIRRSLAIDPKCLEAHLLAADLYGKMGDKDEAMRWYDKAIAINPTDPQAFLARSNMLAMGTDMDDAVAKLEEMRTKDPNYPVDLEIARLYSRRYNRLGGSNNIKYSVEYYDKANLSDMTINDLRDYAVNSQIFNHQERAIEVARYGLQMAPRDFYLNQVLFRGLYNTKQYAAALQQYENVRMAEDYKDDSQNTAVLGLTYCELKRFDEAQQMLDKVQAMADDGTEGYQKAQTLASNGMGNIARGRIKVLTDDGKYEEAVAMYKKFIDERKAQGKLKAYELDAYAGIFMDWSVELNGEEKFAKLRRADAVYLEIYTTFDDPNIKTLSLNKRQTIAYTIDRDNSKGLGRPVAEETCRYCETLTEDDLNKYPSIRPRWALAAYYLTYYYFTQKPPNKALVKKYGDIAINANPTDDSRRANVEKIYKTCKIK